MFSPTRSKVRETTVSWSSGSGSSHTKVYSSLPWGLDRTKLAAEVKRVAFGRLHGDSIAPSLTHVELNAR